MRLKESEALAIKNTFLDVFESGRIFLFGSRIDDQKKGGDIDLYLISDNKDNLSAKKIDFLVQLKHIIGVQKIDVVIDRNNNRPIDIVGKKGIEL